MTAWFRGWCPVGGGHYLENYWPEDVGDHIIRCAWHTEMRIRMRLVATDGPPYPDTEGRP